MRFQRLQLQGALKSLVILLYRISSHYCVVREKDTSRMAVSSCQHGEETDVIVSAWVWNLSFSFLTAAFKNLCSHIWQNYGQQWPCALNSHILRNLWLDLGGVNLDRMIHKAEILTHSTDEQWWLCCFHQVTETWVHGSLFTQAAKGYICYSPVHRWKHRSSVTLQ